MKTKLLLVYSLLALSLSPVTVMAQAQPQNTAKVWTLKECIDYALANNLDVQRSELTVESSEVDKTLAKMAMIPSLNGTLSNNYNWGRSINPVTNEFTTQQIRSLSPNLNSSVTLFNGFRIQNTIRQTNIGFLASEQDLLKSKNDVSLNVINLYINVIFNKELTENAKSQLRSSQQQLERTKKQVAAGALPKSNELNLDAQVATNEVNVINNENLLNLSLLQLKQALQLPGSTALDVEAPELSIEDLVLDQSSQQVFDIAKQSMPEIRSADLKVRAADFGMKAARGQLYPRLSLNGNISSNYSSANDGPHLAPDGGSETQLIPVGFWDNAGTPVAVYREQLVPTGTMTDGYGYSDQLNDNLFRSIGISLSIPLFNGYQARGGVRRAEIAKLNAEITAKQVNQALRQNVESAFNDANAASKSYGANVRQVQAREEAYRMTSQRYELGAANYVEYQVAENDLFQAKSDLTRAKYNFIFRKKLLDFYQGKPLGF
jgi:outer membrane protein